MLIEVKGPSLNEPDGRATVGQWLKAIGDQVTNGEILVEIEAEKTVLEVEATASGVIREILKQRGDEIGSEDVLGVIAIETAKSDGVRVDGATQPSHVKDDARTRVTNPRSNASDPHYDVAVIGGGPGGYAAAIRCAQLGLHTVCIDKRVSAEGHAALGGTCLNVGCIPSKALLDSSHRYHDLVTQFNEHGISFEHPQIDVHRMQKRKEKIVDTLNSGIQGLFRRHGVRHLTGIGTLLGNGRIRVTPTKDAQSSELHAQHIILATGSESVSIPTAPIDDELIVDSTGAMGFDSVPKSLAVIGAGAIGLELGSVWCRLGSKVILLEALDKFLPTVDSDIAQEAFKSFKKQGLDIRLGTKVTAARTNGTEVTVSYEQRGASYESTVDKLVVAVGRRPCTAGLGAIEVGLKLDPRGYIEIDDHCRTNLDNVYAIGDVVSGPMLAHKSSHQAVVVAEQLASGSERHNKSVVIPWVIYTWPEIAWFGYNEQDLIKDGIPYRRGTFPFRASGRALAAGETVGSVKILTAQETGAILGAHIFGPNASELIAEAALAMAHNDGALGLAQTVHAHPTLSEALHEAALAVHGSAIHA